MKAYSKARSWDNGKRKVGAPSAWIWHLEDVTDEYHFETLYDVRPLAFADSEWEPGKKVPQKGMAHLYLGPLSIDVDGDDPSLAYEAAKKVLEAFFDMGLPKNSNQWRLFFSGKKGYHLEIHSSVCNVTQHTKNLPLIYKYIMSKMDLLKYVDSSIYSIGQGQMWRRPNIPRWVQLETGEVVKGPCKVQISLDEFFEGPKLHAELAKTPRPLQDLVPGLALPELVTWMQEFEIHSSQHQSEGMDKDEVRELLQYAYRFDVADCVRKILNQDPSVHGNTHDLIFKMSLYFHHTAHTEEEVIHKTTLWAEAHTSRSYPTPAIRLEHIRSQFQHVKGSPEYRFSCAAMRSTVDKPACEMCPLNKEFVPDTNTYGVVEWQRQYHLIKKGPKENGIQTWDRFPISNFIIVPTRVAKTVDYHNPQSIFMGDIVFNDGKVAKNKIMDLAWVDKPDTFRSKIGDITGTEFITSCIATQNHVQGIRMLLDLRQKKAPLFLDAGNTQGIHMFKGDNGSDGWYFADQNGCKKAGWLDSENVQLSRGSVNASRPNSYLSKYTPIPPAEIDKFAEILGLLQRINAPEVIYPILGWFFACAFAERFRHLESYDYEAGHVPHINKFPLFFYQGEAQTGKTELSEHVLKPLYGMKYPPIDIANNSMAALRRGTLNMSNTFPVILDEWKEEVFSKRNKSASFTTEDAKSLIRSSWNESAYSRSTKDGQSVDFTLLCPLFLMGPTVPNSAFDQAARDRTIIVTGSPQMSRAHASHWNALCGKTLADPSLLPRIGATLINTAMSISDSNLIKIYSFALKTFAQYEDKIRSRKYVGLTKMAFGHVIMDKIFGSSLWNAKAIMPHLLSAVGVFKTPTGSVSEVYVDPSDWDRIMDDIVTMCSHGYDREYAIPRQQAFDLDRDGRDLLMVLDLDQAFTARKRFYRSIGETASDMSVHAFAQQALGKGFLKPWPDGEMVRRNLTITLSRGDKQNRRGNWIRLKVNEMKATEYGKQQAYDFSSVIGMSEYDRPSGGLV